MTMCNNTNQKNLKKDSNDYDKQIKGGKLNLGGISDKMYFC